MQNRDSYRSEVADNATSVDDLFIRFIIRFCMRTNKIGMVRIETVKYASLCFY
jgi:hypothetical protein